MIKTVSVIGPNKSLCSNELYEFGIKLGKMLADLGYVIINGGMEGFMEAVFKGAHLSQNANPVKTIGIIPTLDKNNANKFCDIIIPSGLNYARNQLVINSSDIIIAVGGGAGTLSELAYAWQLKKTVFAFENFEGWAKNLANKKIDNRRNEKIIPVKNLNELKNFLTNFGK